MCARGADSAVDDAEVGSLLEAIDCALDCLLQQSLELARIEAANQERKMAMRTNQVPTSEMYSGWCQSVVFAPQ